MSPCTWLSGTEVRFFGGGLLDPEPGLGAGELKVLCYAAAVKRPHGHMLLMLFAWCPVRELGTCF